MEPLFIEGREGKVNWTPEESAALHLAAVPQEKGLLTNLWIFAA
jgi:hypothetical protein